MPGISWDQNRVAGFYFSKFAVDFYRADAFENIIKFLTDFVIMSISGAIGRQRSFGKALQFNGSIR